MHSRQMVRLDEEKKKTTTIVLANIWPIRCQLEVLPRIPYCGCCAKTSLFTEQLPAQYFVDFSSAGIKHSLCKTLYKVQSFHIVATLNAVKRKSTFNIASGTLQTHSAPNG